MNEAPVDRSDWWRAEIARRSQSRRPTIFLGLTMAGLVGVMGVLALNRAVAEGSVWLAWFSSAVLALLGRVAAWLSWIGLFKAQPLSPVEHEERVTLFVVHAIWFWIAVGIIWDAARANSAGIAGQAFFFARLNRTL